MYKTDTIAAISTGMCAAGISIIRVSGPDAFKIGDSIFRAANGRSVSEMKSFTAAYGHIVVRTKNSMQNNIPGSIKEKTEYIKNGVFDSMPESIPVSDNNGYDRVDSSDHVIDEVLLLKMSAPKTYTREDIIEIDCHGGITVTREVLKIILSAGARLAEPGEFTKRAYLNGRIDLSQAEAVSDLISSGSELAAHNSVRQLSGELKERISGIREELLTKTAYIEAALDDPEHISLDGFDDELYETVRSAIAELTALSDSFSSGRIIKNGVNTVILGSPNVGKSSLMNRILGQERAIVTDIAGTTRDTLSESAVVGGIVLNIIDTAGIRETDDIIESIGVKKAREAAEEADLILYVIDGSDRDITASGIEKALINTVDDISKKTLILINKCDIEGHLNAVSLAGELNEQEFPNEQTFPNKQKALKTGILRYFVPVDSGSDIISENYEKCGKETVYIIEVSAKTGDGLKLFEKTISKMFLSGRINSNDDIFITSLRHKELIDSALKSLENVKSAVDQGMSEDFYTIDLTDAYHFLGLITGENVEDELANKIFSDFCMGK